jgi:hypothetical protein
MTMTLRRISSRTLLFLAITAMMATINIVVAQTSAVALITKSINEVTKTATSGESTPAAKGTILFNDERVKTGKKSLALIKFQDDNSMIRLRELSELTIGNSIENGTSVKSTVLTKGGLGFSVQKQQKNKQFRLTSPTSVASIRGTRGTWAGGAGKDTLLVIEGLVNLKNSKSNKDVDVPAGFIGFSNEDGSLSSRQATEEEILLAERIITGSSMNELKLEIKNPNGSKKVLKLRYDK